MSFYAINDLLALTRSAEYQAFLFNKEPTKGHFMSHMEHLSNRALDAAMLEIFHGLRHVFQSYHNLHSVSPRWAPVLDVDKEFHVEVAIDVQMKDAQEIPGPVQRYRYDEFPNEIGDNTSPFALLLEVCESIYPDVWSSFKNTDLATFKEPFVSIDQISQVMKSDIGPFVIEFEQWALLQLTPSATAIKRKNSL